MGVYVKKRGMNGLKKVMLMGTIMFGLVLSACGQTDKTSDEGEEKAVVAEEKDDTVQPEEESTNVEEDSNEEASAGGEGSANDEAVADDGSFELTEDLYSEEGVTIEYPQIKNLADETKQDEINNMLSNEAYKVMNFYSDTEGLELEIGYTIAFKSPSFLSVQYAGDGYVEGAAHPNHMFYTTNINVENGTHIRLVDVVNVNDAFVELVKSDAFEAVNPDVAEFATDMKGEITVASLQNADNLDSIGTEQHSETFTYFTEDRLGISIPVSHAAGGHAAFEINYDDVPSEFWRNQNILELLQ